MKTLTSKQREILQRFGRGDFGIPHPNSVIWAWNLDRKVINSRVVGSLYDKRMLTHNGAVLTITSVGLAALGLEKPQTLTNWFGQTPHPTDKFVHWNDQTAIGRSALYWSSTSFASFEEYVKALRAAHDLFSSKPELLAAHELLLEAAAHKASMEQGENDAGEDL